MDEFQVWKEDERARADHEAAPVDFVSPPEPGPESWQPATNPSNAIAPGRIAGNFVGLLFASLLGTLAILPFTWTLLKSANPPIVPEPLLAVAMVATVIVELFVSVASILIGLFLGAGAGLGRLLVAPDGSGAPSAAKRLSAWIAEPLAMGMILGGITAVFAMGLDSGPAGAQAAFAMPGAWEGLLASIGAGIREEVWLRYGFMTLIAALGDAIARRVSAVKDEPRAAIITMANVMAALMFAAIHIPLAHAFLGLSPQIVLFVILSNGLPGFVFGWLYWRRGLVPAIVAHFGLDLVLKVILPLVGS